MHKTEPAKDLLLAEGKPIRDAKRKSIQMIGNMVAEFIEERLALGKGVYDPIGGAGDPLLAVPVLYK